MKKEHKTPQGLIPQESETVCQEKNTYSRKKQDWGTSQLYHLLAM